MNSPEHQGLRLFTVSRAARQAPQLLPGQPENRNLLDCAWSADGKKIVFSSAHVPQPVDWPIRATGE